MCSLVGLACETSVAIAVCNHIDIQWIGVWLNSYYCEYKIGDGHYMEYSGVFTLFRGF